MTKQQKRDTIKAWLLFAGLAAVLILTNVACAYI